MSVEAVTPPWDELRDAYAECEEAGRADDVGRQRAALERLALAKEAMGLLGLTLLLAALEHGGAHLNRRFSLIFGGLASGAWDRATAAGRRASHACDELDALRQRVRELERRIEAREEAELLATT